MNRWLLLAAAMAVPAPGRVGAVSASAVASHGAGAAPPALISTESLAVRTPSDSVVVIDVRQAWTSYLQNHLPGAVWLNVESLRAWQGELPFQLLSGPEYQALFTRLGVGTDRAVVVYSAGDQLDIDATFVVWLLASLGHPNVRLLDGGYAKWELEGRTVTQLYPRRPPPGRPLNGSHFRPATASLEDVRGAVKGSGVLLVDARPAEQFGGTAGAQRRRGHIPGAVSHPWKDDLAKPDLALVWRPVAELRAAYLGQGIRPDRDIILYCNSSTEASHLFFALKFLLGYPKVRIYSGAWSQWAEREDTPVE